MSLLTANNVGISFGPRSVVKAVSFELERGQLVGLVGPNGAGKTTMIRALAKLLSYSGRILVEGTSIDAMPRDRLAQHVAYLPQGHQAHWPIRVEELVALGRLPHRSPWQRPSQADRNSVLTAMQRTDTEFLADRKITELSGGERACVMLARALAVEATILLADEPTASLDPYHQLEIMETLQDYSKDGATVIAVLHNLSLAARFCHRILLMDRGRLIADGGPDEVLSDENLRAVYRVESVRGEFEQRGFVLPWKRIL